jgi:hypothetical protein
MGMHWCQVLHYYILRAYGAGLEMTVGYQNPIIKKIDFHIGLKQKSRSVRILGTYAGDQEFV